MNVSVYDYLDYRKLLHDLFEQLHRANPKFSKREFARIAGSSAPNFLQHILQRKMHLSQEAVEKVSEHCRLTIRQIRYFKLLVEFDHATAHEQKDKIFSRLVSAREFGEVKELQQNQYRYLSHWYMPVVRELVTSSLYPGDPEWIARHIVPTISASKVRKAIELLRQLNLIQFDEKAQRFILTQQVVSTPAEVMSMAVISYYKGIFARLSESLERFSPQQRDIRGVTLGISAKTYAELKEHMERFWKEVMEKAQQEQEVEQVYYVGLSLFPLSKGPTE